MGAEASLEGLVWAVALAVPATLLVSALAALLERSGPIRLRHWAEEAGGRLRQMYDQPLRFAVFRSLLSFAGRLLPLASYLAAAALLVRLHAGHPVAGALGLCTLLVALGESINRMLVARDAESALRALTGLYRVALLLLLPLVAAFAAAAALLPRREVAARDEDEDDEAASDEEIEAFIDVGTREGIIEAEQGEWLSAIVDFPETQVRSVMTPRIDMVCAPIDSPLDALAERFIESGHTRIALYQESIDHIVGVLHVRDAFRAVRQGVPLTSDEIRHLAKPPFFIPETKPLAELLRDLQSRHQQMAIVVDEYGGTAGLVTVEDLVEEIVGEITDEREGGPPADQHDELADGVWRLGGRTHVEELDELFGVDIEDPEYETVGGLIFSALGHVPHAGETVERAGLRFTVDEVVNRRIKAVRVERIQRPPDAPAAEAAEPA